MSIAELTEQFDYGYWANAKLFRAVETLTLEQFVQPVAGSYGSVRNTLVHTMSAEWGWLDRSGGPHWGPKLAASDYPDFESIRSRWEWIEREARAFFARVRDEDLGRVAEFSFGGPTMTLSVAEMLRHAAIHGVHHRGQVALLLRLLGCPPGDFDMDGYYIEKRAQRAEPGRI